MLQIGQHKSPNQLTNLPKLFGNLKSLQHLELEDNNLTALPETFSNLHKLQLASLSHNQLIKLPKL